MKRRTLKDTNPYLRDPKTAERYIFTSVSSSTAVEGIHIKREDCVTSGSALSPAAKSSKSRA